MPKGLAVPVGVSPGGGMKVVEGTENDEKILLLGLGSDDNDNAFQQDIGVGDDMVFDIDDALIRPRILVRLQTVFARFEQQKRFRLRENTIKWQPGENPGELVLSFRYVSLESDEEKKFRRTFRGAGQGAGGDDSTNAR